jgi:hypothetical protein
MLSRDQRHRFKLGGFLLSVANAAGDALFPDADRIVIGRRDMGSRAVDFPCGVPDGKCRWNDRFVLPLAVHIQLRVGQ